MAGQAERTLRPEDEISHYRIVSPLGAGGMGEVYLAQDRTLERRVALKILPPELVRSEDRVRRFVLEAKSASSLSHPNIVTIYEIGQDPVRSPGAPDSDPVHYISMELVSGKTLAALIHDDKTDLRTLLGYLAQAAEGLSKAHAAGHRAPRPQAREHHGLGGRLHEGPRLRPRQAHREAGGGAGHLRGPDPRRRRQRGRQRGRDGRVHVARAGRRAGPSTTGPTSSRSAASSTRRPPGGSPSRPRPASRRCTRSSTRSRSRWRRSTTRSRPSSGASSGAASPRAPTSGSSRSRTWRSSCARSWRSTTRSRRPPAPRATPRGPRWRRSRGAPGGCRRSWRPGSSPPPGSRSGGGACGGERARARSPPAFQTMRMSTQTSRGDVLDSVISPDGRYLAYLAGRRGPRQPARAPGRDRERRGGAARAGRRPREPGLLPGRELRLLPRPQARQPQLPGAPPGPVARRDAPGARVRRGLAGQLLARREAGSRSGGACPRSGNPGSSSSTSRAAKERLLATVAEPEVYQGPPAWSPDGTTIAASLL